MSERKEGRDKRQETRGKWGEGRETRDVETRKKRPGENGKRGK
jgi:hypothetical protein